MFRLRCRMSVTRAFSNTDREYWREHQLIQMSAKNIYAMVSVGISSSTEFVILSKYQQHLNLSDSDLTVADLLTITTVHSTNTKLHAIGGISK